MNLIKKYTSKFSVKTLFEAWISPKMVIPPITKIEVAPVVGGHFRLYSERGDFETVMNGRFIELEENKKVKYSWHWDGSEEVSIVTVEFEEFEKNTVININHEGFNNEESRDMHAIGWDWYMKELEVRLAALSTFLFLLIC
ncbi:Uncharacterized conserved protein YndB, AHSA1/START domain [Reichenbachiella faecimaris]|uniref:Uncharacterized conserved protein YndB, AHSA1/START domain n=1 Tax=Reichenbachiella faecimaris TaxID=692418 RepID=A0A1W2GI57_REIFA|nr:SRPBCC family protein [Reichenbachiella faecimaris]SMD36038.1 Uncharacterized conserved protein YndB, AHSA1/START domain [Reichenbachiella faecimaris]